MKRPVAAAARAAKAKGKAAKAKATRAGGGGGGGGGGAARSKSVSFGGSGGASASSAKSKAAHRPHIPAAARGGGGGGGGGASHKPRKLTPDGDVALCSARAVAESLRLTGQPVGDGEVLALHWAAGGGADAGAPILAVLQAALERGVAGTRPVCFGPVDLDDPAAVILGVDLPGPHAVLVDEDGWWSWGGLYDPAEFPDAVVEEAWSVAWS